MTPDPERKGSFPISLDFSSGADAAEDSSSTPSLVVWLASSGFAAGTERPTPPPPSHFQFFSSCCNYHCRKYLAVVLAPCAVLKDPGFVTCSSRFCRQGFPPFVQPIPPIRCAFCFVLSTPSCIVPSRFIPPGVIKSCFWWSSAG